MDAINELLELLKIYIEHLTKEPSFIDTLVQNILPIITALILILSSLFGVKKYYNSKNREINEKILKEVYAPLYQYFIRQETYAYIHLEGRDYRESPILELTNVKTKTVIYGEGQNKKEVNYLFSLSRYNILDLKNNINFGLVSQELITLLNIYEVLIFMESNYSKSTDEYCQATCIKVDVENAIRKEVFMGYQKYYKKLGLSKNTIVNMWDLSEDQISFKMKKDKQYIEDFKKTQ